MRKLLLLLFLTLLLTACTPRTPDAAAVPTACAETPAPLPTQTEENELHALLDSLAPQTLNMFRPFAPIELSPQQFLDEMAAIRALPFEDRTDWFVNHGLCLPQPSPDTDTDWQGETNLWSTYADYREAAVSEPIYGRNNGAETQWQIVYSVPTNHGGAERCRYAVLFEQQQGKPWQLMDILYQPQVWTGSHNEHTLFASQTDNTLSVYDPAQRRLILTAPTGVLDTESEGVVTRYAADSWEPYPAYPLSRLAKEDVACIRMLYERYPSGQIEFDRREAFGGYALLYKMENHLPVQIREVRQEGCDPHDFLLASSEDLLRDDYICRAYSKERGDAMEEAEFSLSKTRTLEMNWVADRTQPLQSGWRDLAQPYVRIELYENGQHLQTLAFSELAHLADENPETGGGFTEYNASMPYVQFYGRDLNLDGWEDLVIGFDAQLPCEYDHAYYLIWDEQSSEFVFWRANDEPIHADPDARTLTYLNKLGAYAGQHTDRILPDGSIVHERLTLHRLTPDSSDVHWQMRQDETYDPPREFLLQNGQWIEVQP